MRFEQRPRRGAISRAKIGIKKQRRDGVPSIPSLLVTTGVPMAKASRIFTFMPLPTGGA